MKPMFQWGHYPEVEGTNEPLTDRSVWRVGTPLRGYGPSLDPYDEQNGLDYPAGLYDAPGAQLVVVARRSATATIARGGAESEAAAAIRAEEAAIAALGAWVDVDPYEVATPFADSSGGYDYSEAGVAYYTGTADEEKFQVRIAPPYSSRAKVRYSIWEDATATEHDLEYEGVAGVSYMGIPRCIPLALDSPIVDGHWIYLLETPVALSAAVGVYKYAELVFANSYRAPAA